MTRTPSFAGRLLQRSLLVAATATALLTGSLVAGPNATADSAVAPLNSTITVTGAGWGHGIGMSQYGAYGAAASGLSWKEILDFYYPNTSLDTLAEGNTIRVWISADNDNRLHVRPASGLRLKDTAGKVYTLPTGDKYRLWRISRSGSYRTLQYKNSSGTWVTRDPGLSRTRVWYVDNPTAGHVRVLMPDGTTRSYRGKTALQFYGSGARTVNTVSMELYLRSVVPSEMPTSWPADAVRAQSVAARSYAARTRANASAGAVYDICDTTYCQVYRGYAQSSGSSTTVNEFANGNAAIEATAGKVLTSGDTIALTMFSSSNGGHSADGGKPYLVAKEDPYDGKMRNQSWSVSLSSSKIQGAYPSIGTLKSVRVVSRDGDGPWGGRATSVTITGTKTSVTVTGGAFKSTFGLKERLFLVTAGLKPGTGNYERWKDLGGVTGWVGAPKASEKSVDGGLHAPFKGADLLWTSTHGSHWVKGEIRTRYLDVGGPGSDLGFPTTDHVDVTLNAKVADDVKATDAAKVSFTGGAIWFSEETGARVLTGRILARYKALGYEESDLGLPTSDVTTTSTGAKATFQIGVITCPTDKECVVTYG